MKYGKVLMLFLVLAVAGAEGMRGQGIAAEGKLDALGDSLIKSKNRIQFEVKPTVAEQAGKPSAPNGWPWPISLNPKP